MPLMERSEHEKLLNELLTIDLEQSRKTEILQSLRQDHGVGHAEFGDLSKSSDKLQRDNSDLIISNSQLFRQIGITGSKEEVEQKKEVFSETVTLEEIEKRLR